MIESEEHKKLAWEGITYSEKRLDLLIITISGAGIYVCLETIKFIIENNLAGAWLIKFSGISFLLTIILNVISQYSGRLANRYHYLMHDCIIEADKKKENPVFDVIQNEKERKFYFEKSEKFDRITTNLNNLSGVIMINGLILLLLFFCFYF